VYSVKVENFFARQRAKRAAARQSNQSSKSGPEGKPSASYGVKFLSKKVRLLSKRHRLGWINFLFFGWQIL